jgi:hypothetical protein
MPTALNFADTKTLSNSQGLWLFLIVVIGILLAGVVVIVGRKLLDDQPSSLIRSWIAISLVLGLLAFCAAAFLITDTTLRSTLFGGLIASVAAAVAFYFSSSAADKTRADLLKAISQSAPSAAAPTVTGLSPTSGASGGGDTVTVSGTGFTGATAVNFGSVAATNLIVQNDTQLTVTSPLPSASGPVDVTVITPAGTSAISTADQFTYVVPPAAAPTVTGLNPTSGTLGGGNNVTVRGTGFTGATAVNFGSVAATNLIVQNDTQLTVTSPTPSASGPVDVTVITPAGTSAISMADRFTYGP